MNNKLKYIMFYILGILTCSGVVYAITIYASDITYDNTRSGLKDANNNDVDNVKDAIDALYSKATSGSGSNSGPLIINRITGGETYKGVIYLDPTNLNNTCNESNSISSTGIKIGCMKWYIFDDSNDTYKMILDHNTTSGISWNDSNSNVAYEQSNLKDEVDNLSKTIENNGSGWEVPARLITAAEVVGITGKTGFNANNSNSWYYLDTNNQNISSFTIKNRSRYDWLYNNLNICKTDSTDYGCSIEDANAYGYWTSTTVGSPGTDSLVWNIYRYGTLRRDYANNSDRGIRPVIELSKSLFE